jgi:hypothetical protein
MALIKTGSTISNISGSIGGTTYSRNRGGAYARNRTIPVQPNSAYQVAAKALFQSASGNWTSTLTASQRTAWEAYAASVPYTNKLGEKKYYTGQQRYVQTVMAGVNAGLTMVSFATAPSSTTEATNVAWPSTAFSQGGATADSTIKVAAITAPADVTVGDLLLMYIGKPISQARRYNSGPWRYAGKSVYATGGSYPTVTLTDPYASTDAAGKSVPVMLRVLKADGRLSVALHSIVTLGAHAA